MKTLNWKYEETVNKELEYKMQKCLDMAYSYLLNNYPELCKQENFKGKYDNLIVVNNLIDKNGKHLFHLKKNGQLYLMSTSTAASETGYVDQEFDQEKLEWDFNPGIVTHISVNEHKIIHELIHYFSLLRKSKIIDGKLKDKSGFHFTIYDKDDKVISNEYSNIFITEGITEYLASKISGHSPSAYYENFVITNILNIGNDELVKIYFSSNAEDIIKYKDNFEKVTNRSFFDIFNVNKDLKRDEKIPNQKMCDIIQLSVNYKINSCKSLDELNEFITEINRYTNDIYFLDVLRKYKIDINTIKDYIIQCKKIKEQDLSNIIEKKDGVNMNYADKYAKALTNLINEFIELKRINGSNEQFNNMIKELLELESSIENDAELTANYKTFFGEKIDQLKQKIKEYKSQREMTQESYSYNNSTNYEDLLQDFKTRLKRVLLKEEEYGDKVYYEPELLQELIIKYKNLRKELDTNNIINAFSTEPSVRENLISRLDKKISNLKLVDKTYNQIEYNFGRKM